MAVQTGRPVADESSSTARGRCHLQRFAIEFDYPVHFTEALFDPGNDVLVRTLARREPDKRHRAIVFIDDGVAGSLPDLCVAIEAYADAHAAGMELACAPIPVPGGERIKNELFYIEQMQRKMFEHGIDRHSYVIGIGGGAVLDAVGLAAATCHRGIRHIRVPTTVLSQNDSGVGVKNGINQFGSKNFVGTFAPPFAVLNDLTLLEHLPAREKIAGMAEAVKVALIRDATFFEWLEANGNALVLFERPAMAYMIERCAELHMRQIAHGGDPFETGSARPLDFGHWSAHKLETLTRNHVRHGEAVAIGIALDSRYSVIKGLLEEGADTRICALLDHLGFRLWHPGLRSQKPDGTPALIQGLREFREHLGGELTITLLEAIGRGVEVHEMDEAAILAAIDWLEARASLP